MNEVLWALIALTMFILAMLSLLVANAQRLAAKTEGKHDHAVCIAAIAGFVGNQFGAQVLDAAAEYWETSEGKADVKRVIATQWTEQGPEIPSLWMRDRAAALRGYAIDSDEEPDE